AFGSGGRFLGPALGALSVDRTVALFEAEGVATKIEANGKIFPVSDKATDVLAALLQRLQRSGAELRGQSPALGIDAAESAGWLLRLPDTTICARRVIVAVGGRSYPGSGTSGDGYAIAQHFGHTLVAPRPALVPIRVDAPWIPTLRGLTVPDVSVTVRTLEPPRTLAQRREALLFAHFGLTGPAILDVSRA